MVNLIVGANAIGKTRCLLNLARDYKHSGNKMVVFSDSETLLKTIPLDKRIVNIIVDTLLVNELRVVNNSIVWVDFSDADEAALYNEHFYKVITLIAKDVNYVLLDEPTIGISRMATKTLRNILTAIQQLVNDKDIWITTHSDIIGSVEDCKYYTVTDTNELVKGDEELAYELLW